MASNHQKKQKKPKNASFLNTPKTESSTFQKPKPGGEKGEELSFYNTDWGMDEDSRVVTGDEGEGQFLQESGGKGKAPTRELSKKGKRSSRVFLGAPLSSKQP